MSLASALASGDVAQLPSRRDEDWRWSDLYSLIRQLPPPSPAFAGGVGEGPFVADETLAVVNGQGPSALVLEAGETRLTALRFVSATAETGHAARFSVTLGAGAVLTLLESHEGLAAGYMTEVDLDFTLGEGARLERIVLAQDHPDAVSVVDASVALSASAAFSQTLLTTGARRQRLETRVDHPGEGAKVRLDGLYRMDVADSRNHADLTTLVTHAGVDGATAQLTKGVVGGRARAVFQGRIVVRPGADRTDARMGHHALILSERAEVDAKPELEIWADDVACAHGNTVGALDEEAVFYARQRGLPEVAARALLTTAFLGEVVDRIEHEGAREAVRVWLAAGSEAA